MKADLKRRWIEALRSGKFTQGRNFLCIRDEYCCLGVLAEIEGDLQQVNGFKETKCLNNIKTLEFFYLNKYGLSNDEAHYLACLNDGTVPDRRPCNFREIADWIEENIKGEDE